jgi:pimeloyl-ACP methyl ester carboxylesterase
LLENAGHRAIASDLPGTGENTSIDPAAATLAIWADFIAGHVQESQTPIYLVGHSRGGHVIGEVAERVPDKIAGLMYLVGVLSPPGLSMFDTVSTHARIDPPNTPMIRMPDEYMRTQMLNRCSPALADELVARLFVESLTPAKTPSSVTFERWGKVPRAYIECSDDISVPLESQRAIQARAPCDIVVTLDTDHCPFLSAPQDLTKALLDIAGQFSATGHPLLSSRTFRLR